MISILTLVVADVPPEYTIAQWPTYYDEAEVALKSLVDTHRVNYLEAYDMHGKLLWPSQYRKYLQGALVQIHFTLTHWSIGGKPAKDGRPGRVATDTYVADIFSMRVLVPPADYGQPVTPRKRKFHKSDPMTLDISPKKFRTFASSSGRYVFSPVQDKNIEYTLTFLFLQSLKFIMSSHNLSFITNAIPFFCL